MKSKKRQDNFLKQQEKLNNFHPERVKYSTNIRTCSESCAIFIKCPKYSQSKGNLCKIIIDYQEELKEKIKQMPTLTPQALVMAEFAFGNLLKIREIENLITIEGFITKTEDEQFTTHPLVSMLLRMQESVRRSLLCTKTEIKALGNSGKKSRREVAYIPYAEVLKKAVEHKEGDD